MKFKRNLLILSAILIIVLILVSGCVTPPTPGDVPSGGTISIAGGAATTNDTTPSLTISATDATHMAFSGDGTTWSSWITYATSYSLFNITTGAGCTSGDGTKKVYVKFKNDAGESTKIYDSIVLDTVAPKLSSVVYTDVDISGTVNNGDKITFTFDDEMLTSTVTSTNVATSLLLSVGNYGTGATISWDTTLKICTVTLGISPIIISGTTVNPASSVTDTAGNADNSSAVTIITVVTPPTPTVDPAKLFVSAQTGEAKYTALPAEAISVTVYSAATKDPVAALANPVRATIIFNDSWTTWSAAINDNEYIYFMITYSDTTTSPVTYDGQLPDKPDGTALANIQATNKNTVTSSAAGNVAATDKITLYVGPGPTRYSEPTPLGTMTTAINLANTDAPLYTRTNVNGHESALSNPDGAIVEIASAAYTNNGGAADGKVDPGDVITITYSGSVTVTPVPISFSLGGTTITANLTSTAATNAVLTITGGPYDFSAQATVNFNLADENIVDAAGGGNWAFEHASGIVWTPGADF